MKRASSLRSRDTPRPFSCVSRSIVSGVEAMANLPVSGRLRRERLRRVLDRLDDVLVARAAAQVAGHPVADLLLRRARVLLQQPVRAGDHPGRAVAALQAVLLRERLLQRMQLAALLEALDGEHVGALALHGE